jgi:putative toxin-antitoxin system antitoxin component (TIGR02293 family)
MPEKTSPMPPEDAAKAQIRDMREIREEMVAERKEKELSVASPRIEAFRSQAFLQRLAAAFQLPKLDAVTTRATEVLGDQEKAFRWLRTPISALGYATPISKLQDEAGVEEVMSVLDGLEQCVW